ncbi:F0F1 ATP synthase subunit alpha [Marinobacter santoriniensis NKSG1]|uniref:ATP synthase subunit alpha n=1 Tax=Marinobacter santoriniensis NKSG1 TaxID=1288826 RepID=M7CV72_9GAMM|nr:F0F1 ATP synthase subunit alpha [Marinobacter santoriniensis]EMP57446.1 F0F1 ATP synthase subunit alpha [Marinobacter santoriniensis NKSG1]
MSEPDVNNGSLLEAQSRWIDGYQPDLRIRELGTVISVGDGIVWIAGLPSAAMDDVLEFEDGSRAMVFDIKEDLLGAILLHDTDQLTASTLVHRTGRGLYIPVGDTLLGRIVDPLGIPLDDEPAPIPAGYQPLEAPSPPIAARDFVQRPLYTGVRTIDTMIPVGKGQRQLLIGDEGLGRSSIAIDTVINQRGRDVYCVYVLIGQKRSTVVNTIDTLKRYEAMDYTTVVVAEASGLPGLQHLAPFAGCAIAEFWMHQGHDVLVVYDDLSTHAKTYRELSLLLRRTPGREAYPGDIFSMHARLLERATCLQGALGGGSMTALPIVETQQGEISAYIPTNLISITDGQIYLDRNLFSSGFRPAIDIGRSVSRIGGQAQHSCIKDEAKRMKLDYLQFLELEVFTRFGARLEATMETAIHRGQVLREILKQDRLSPLNEKAQIAWLIAFNDRRFEGLDLDRIAGMLETLDRAASETTLDLESSREDWSAAIAQWLSVEDGDTGHDQPA